MSFTSSSLRFFFGCHNFFHERRGYLDVVWLPYVVVLAFQVTDGERLPPAVKESWEAVIYTLR